MKLYRVALFGEAEKGEFRFPYIFDSVPQLLENLGHPPSDSRGIFYAIQALLFNRELVFFRVREEGFSYQDYISGIHLLMKKELSSHLTAICMPGVGDAEIIEAVSPICASYRSLLITTEEDLYDYLTEMAA